MWWKVFILLQTASLHPVTQCASHWKCKKALNESPSLGFGPISQSRSISACVCGPGDRCRHWAHQKWDISTIASAVFRSQSIEAFWPTFLSRSSAGMKQRSPAPNRSAPWKGSCTLHYAHVGSVLIPKMCVSLQRFDFSPPPHHCKCRQVNSHKKFTRLTKPFFSLWRDWIWFCWNTNTQTLRKIKPMNQCSLLISWEVASCSAWRVKCTWLQQMISRF